MEKIIFILIVPFLLCFSGYSVSQVEPEEEVIITKPAEDSADMDTFYDELSKDGDWIKVEKDEIDSEENLELSETVDIDEDVITEYIWRPRISYTYVNWNPYSYGHWEFTRFGWVWVSDYEWGWAPYHYGRWWFSMRWGWVWSPGHRWAPSWVSWCHTRNHIGWHPISPRTPWRHHKGVIVTNPITPRQKSITNKWTFVKKEDFTKKVTNETAIDLKNNKNFVSDAKITTSGKEVYNTGPKKKDIENSTGTKITTKKVSVVNTNNETSKFNNSSKSKNLNEKNTGTKKKNENVYKSNESSNTGDKQIKKNTEPKNKQENTTKNPNGNREKNNNTKNTNKESNKNTNTNKESNRNSNTKKETNKAPTYNPGNSNKNKQKETYKAPTYNPGNSNKSGNSNNGSKPNNSPGNNNKNSSPPPKKK
ncbi:MAG: DUF6600 domain-containing protein [Ignavibacteria bacterium]|jgi:hypothetical protein